MPTQRDMLVTCRDQFAMYAQNHRAKVGPLSAARLDLDGSSSDDDRLRIEKLTADIASTLLKAEENERLCREIQAVIDQTVIDQNVERNVLADTAEFGISAYADGISPKNQQTQLGVHFEEVAEMIATISSPDPITLELLIRAHHHMNALATQLKTSDPVTFISNRLEFLDACCDQLVTATLCAVLFHMDPVGGLNEVNRSNFSKLVDGVMQKAPVTAKWIKGPDYSPPDLTPFI